MINFILLLIAIECILLTLIVLNMTKKMRIPTRLLELVIVASIILAIVINTLIVFNRQ